MLLSDGLRCIRVATVCGGCFRCCGDRCDQAGTTDQPDCGSLLNEGVICSLRKDFTLPTGWQEFPFFFLNSSPSVTDFNTRSHFLSRGSRLSSFLSYRAAETHVNCGVFFLSLLPGRTGRPSANLNATVSAVFPRTSPRLLPVWRKTRARCRYA